MLRLATALGSLALATLLSAPALAQGVGVGVAIPGVQVGGQINFGVPPIVYQAPPPPQIIMAPPPQAPPVVVYAPVPQQRPMYAYAPPQQPAWGASRLGLDLRVDGAAGFNSNKAGDAYGVGGAGLGLRYRATPHFGIELGADFLGGRDWNDHKTTEIAGNFGGLVYLNPRSRAQLYLSGGLLVDHASASPSTSTTACPVDADFACPASATQRGLSYTHVGGYAGLGLEIFATRRIAFHVDGRGFVRQNIGGDSPEFTDTTTGRSTNTSGGILGSAGVIFYF